MELSKSMNFSSYGKKSGDLDYYKSLGIFNEDQIDQLQLGFEKNLDVSIYAKPEFSKSQMYLIRKGLEDGSDVSSYANPKLSWTKMKEIRISKRN